MIKRINILQNNIEIIEERKGFFGIKEINTTIDISKIDTIERIIKNDELIGIVLWQEEDVLYAMGIKNYENDLEELYNKILSKLDKNAVTITESEA